MSSHRPPDTGALPGWDPDDSPEFIDGTEGTALRAQGWAPSETNRGNSPTDLMGRAAQSSTQPRSVVIQDKNEQDTAVSELEKQDQASTYNAHGIPLTDHLEAEVKMAPARHIVRLFQCRRCSSPIEEPVTLPCGKSICKACLPETHARSSISYPAQPERLQGFQCPFAECSKEHSIGDCNVDVILNKAAHHMKAGLDVGKAQAMQLAISTCVVTQDPWEAAGISSLKETGPSQQVNSGGKLLATWTMAANGALNFEAEVSYPHDQTLSSEEDVVGAERELLDNIREATRAEMDCQVCYALFFDPLTTGCGHTFCRPCLHRILDHSNYCPICRRKLTINPLFNHGSCPSNERIISIMETFWGPELKLRNDTANAELAARDGDLNVPLFICTLSFPFMPTFLHIFEPRYRLMIRRVLEGNRVFGMVLPKRPRHPGDAEFHELGTLLRLVNVQFYPDGRSLIETVGLSRFRVLRHGFLDGYVVGKTERIDDISLEEEEAREASERVDEAATVMTPTSTETPNPMSLTERNTYSDAEPHPAPPDSNPQGSTFANPTETQDNTPSAFDLEGMSTQNLMQYATNFVIRMRAQSVPWLTERMLVIYGECPDDPAIFPWWLASMLPVRDLEKYRLLGTSSVRDRLKICCLWILEWESRA